MRSVPMYEHSWCSQNAKQQHKIRVIPSCSEAVMKRNAWGQVFKLWMSTSFLSYTFIYYILPRKCWKSYKAHDSRSTLSMQWPGLSSRASTSLHARRPRKIPGSGATCPVSKSIWWKAVDEPQLAALESPNFVWKSAGHFCSTTLLRSYSRFGE